MTTSNRFNRLSQEPIMTTRNDLSFITTGDVNWFEELGRRLLGPELDRAEKLSW